MWYEVEGTRGHCFLILLQSSRTRINMPMQVCPFSPWSGILPVATIDSSHQLNYLSNHEHCHSLPILFHFNFFLQFSITYRRPQSPHESFPLTGGSPVSSEGDTLRRVNGSTFAEIHIP